MEPDPSSYDAESEVCKQDTDTPYNDPMDYDCDSDSGDFASVKLEAMNTDFPEPEGAEAPEADFPEADPSPENDSPEMNPKPQCSKPQRHHSQCHVKSLHLKGK